MSQIQNLAEVESSSEYIGEDIHVFGDVYKDSIIDAHELFVKGIVHESSAQFVKYAEINEFQGILRCHKAKISTLNGGEVHASRVVIENCLCGSIFAQDVTIKNLSSNVTIYASNSITIETIDGSSNQLSINYKKIPILVSKLELIKEDIEELTLLLETAKKNNLLTQKDIEDEIYRLNKKLEDIIDSSKNAKISIEKVKANNNICFSVDDNNSIHYKTQKTAYSSFYLRYDNNQIILEPTQTTITL